MAQKTIVFPLQPILGVYGTTPFLNKLRAQGDIQPDPFVVDDWPLPARRRADQEIDESYNDLPLVAAGQTKYLDWPLPSRRRAALFDTTAVNLLPTLLSVAAVTYIFRQPVVARTARRASLQAESYVNLLPLNSIVAAADPFVPEDWPLPARRAANSASQGHLDQTRTQYIPPPWRAEWPNPAARRATLQAEPDTIFPGLGIVQPEVRPDTYPLPVKAKPPIEAVSEASWPGLFIAQPERRQQDWPNPARKVAAQQSEPFIGALRFPVVAADAPFIQTDWQAPARRRQALSAQIARLPHETETLGRGNQEHRIPVRRPITPEQVINQIVLGIAAPVFPAPSQTDWPNPASRARSQRGDSDRGAIRLPVEVPVRPLEWPLPPKRISQQAEPYESGAILLPPGVVAVPFTPQDWTKPAPKVRSQAGDADRGTIRLPQGDPFRASDWPAASRLRRLVQSEIVVNLPLLAAASTPFAQADWRTASRAGRIGRTDQFVNRLALTTVVVAGNPFITPAWMLPKAARRSDNTGQLDNFLPLHGGTGTVTSQGGSGTNTLLHGAAAAATTRLAGTVASDRGANTVADDRIAGSPATGRGPGTTATPR